MSIINRKKQNREYAKSVQMNVTFPSPAQRAAVQQLIADKSEIEGVNFEGGRKRDLSRLPS